MSLHAGSTPVIFADLDPVQPLDTIIPRFVQGRSKPLDTCTEEARNGWSPALDMLAELDEQTARYGDCIYVAARQEQLAAPKDLFTAQFNHALQEEAKAGTPLHRKAKKELKDQILHELKDKWAPKITGTPMVIDATGAVVVGAGNLTRLGAVEGLLMRTFGSPGQPVIRQLTPETFAWTKLEIDPLDLPQLHLGTHDENVPLGPQFLTWLWYRVEQGELAWMVDGPLRFVGDVCDAGQTDLRKGLPTHAAEATAALRSGKYLASATVMISDPATSEVTTCRFDADNFILKSVHLPAGQELDAEAHFSERVGYLRRLRTIIEEQLTVFILGLANETLQEPMQAWLDEREAKHHDA